MSIILEVIVDAADEQRFREFVSARSPALMRLGFLLTGGDQHAAEDLVQTALAKLVTRWRRVEAPEAYAKQIMYRQQVSRWRASGRRGEVVQASPPELADRDLHHQSELRMVLRSALSRLTARQRAVLVLRYFEDLPEQEMARVLGCSVGTVRSTVHRSLARLRMIAPELAQVMEVTR
jgi:RNA polymerase sigma-70 factor (sigma-E family)